MSTLRTALAAPQLQPTSCPRTVGRDIPSGRATWEGDPAPLPFRLGPTSHGHLAMAMDDGGVQATPSRGAIHPRSDPPVWPAQHGRSEVPDRRWSSGSRLETAEWCSPSAGDRADPYTLTDRRWSIGSGRVEQANRGWLRGLHVHDDQLKLRTEACLS